MYKSKSCILLLFMKRLVLKPELNFHAVLTDTSRWSTPLPHVAGYPMVLSQPKPIITNIAECSAVFVTSGLCFVSPFL